MPASKYDFSIEQGASFRLSLIYKDSDKNPIDLTNWCARLIWTTNKNITQTFISTNTSDTSYSFTIEPLLGKITLLISADTTNNFAFNTAKYDLELQSDDDLYTGGGKDIIKILYGTITLFKRYSNTNNLLECNI